MPKVVDHEARRREITQIAIELIADSGLEAASIREIAKAAGYSKGVVEHYFDNKEAIISAALALLNDNYGVRADNASAGLRGLAAIRRRVEATLPLTEEIRREWKVRLVFWSMASIDKTLKKQQGARLRRAGDHFAAHFQEAIEDGELTPRATAKDYGRRLVNATTGIAIGALHNPAYSKRDFLLTEIDNLIESLSQPHP